MNRLRNARSGLCIVPLFLAVLLTAPDARAANRGGVEFIAACARENVPEPDTVRAMRFTSRDRVGSKRVTRLKVSGHRGEDGGRRMLAQFTAPEEMVGTTLLLIERDGENEIYFKSADLPVPKRLNGPDQSLSMFGTDFTFEDFEHFQKFNMPGLSKRLDDERIGGRDVWVVETLPSKSASSAYSSVVTFVDKETCIALKIEMFEAPGKRRKILTVDPNRVLKRGDVWIAHQALMKDLRDHTDTQLHIESIDIDVAFDEDAFTVERLTSN